MPETYDELTAMTDTDFAALVRSTYDRIARLQTEASRRRIEIDPDFDYVGREDGVRFYNVRVTINRMEAL